MTMKPILRIALIFLSWEGTSSCRNNESFRYRDNARFDCKWVRNKESRRQRLCSTNETIRNECVVSCGICCEDDDSYSFKIKSKKVKNCRWLASRTRRQEKWCTDNGATATSSDQQFKTWQNGRMIRDACPEACDRCFNFVELEEELEDLQHSPSSSPSFGLASAHYVSAFPSEAPTFVSDDVPSNIPSSSPSSFGFSDARYVSGFPTIEPSYMPSFSQFPSNTPSNVPSDVPSDVTIDVPSNVPSNVPTSLSL